MIREVWFEHYMDHRFMGHVVFKVSSLDGIMTARMDDDEVPREICMKLANQYGVEAILRKAGFYTIDPFKVAKTWREYQMCHDDDEEAV